MAVNPVRARLSQEQILEYEMNYQRRRKRYWLMFDMLTSNDRIWMESLCESRPKEGQMSTIWRHIFEDEDYFYNFLRMSFDQFNTLLRLVDPIIDRNQGLGRESISSRDRLAVTLR